MGRRALVARATSPRALRSVAFDPAVGDVAATVGEEAVVRLWHVTADHLHEAATIPASDRAHVAFEADGGSLLVGASPGLVDRHLIARDPCGRRIPRSVVRDPRPEGVTGPSFDE